VRIRSVLSHSAQAVAEGALISLLVVGLMAGTAFAAKPGSATGSAAALSITPNPIPAWSSFHGSGCGYTVGKQVNINVYSPTWQAGFPVGVDASGCMTFMFYVDGAGSYTITSSQAAKGHRQTQIASVVVSVY
jgi:hypothetical protein